MVSHRLPDHPGCDFKAYNHCTSISRSPPPAVVSMEAYVAGKAVCTCIQAFGLSAAIGEEALFFLCLERNWSSLNSAIEDLVITEETVKEDVEAEERQNKKRTRQVDRWLGRVAKQLKEQIAKEEVNGSHCAWNLAGRCRLGKQIAEKLKEVNKLVEEGKQITEFARKLPQDSVLLRPKPRAFVILPALKQLQELFDDEEKGIIGIWGQGGVGKSTLLNEFNNKLKERRGEFNVVIWIDVSNYKKLNVVNIQKMITHRLDLTWNNNENEEIRATSLVNALRNKKFVILLDDVWEEFELEKVGIPAPDAARNNKCKIILATRDKNVCVQMGANDSLIEMPLLDEKAAVELFRSNLTADDLAAIDDSPGGKNDIRDYAKAIVQNCAGLPLALNVIGRAVAGSKNPKDWKFAKKATKGDLAGIYGADAMFKRLKYSYYRLNQQLKDCFLDCTLFPANSWIMRDQLEDYLMAEGLVSSNIKLLAYACLLQFNESETEVKMHHIIREMGRSIATKQGKFLVEAGMGLEVAPDETDRWKKVTRISLMSNDIKKISISPKCHDLLTLLLQNNPNLERLSPKFFRSMSSLRVLDLSDTAITELPECDALVNLQYLNLSHTRIIRLPKNFWILKQLMHLDLSVTSALVDTSDNCSKLLELRVLNLFRSNYGIRDVNDLNIDTLEKLEFLGIAIYDKDVLAKLKEQHPLAKSTCRLSLKNCAGMESIQISELKKMVQLKELYIEFCDDLKELTADDDEQDIFCLQVLTLADLSNLETVSVGKVPHYFRGLRNLTIQKCHKLDNISWVLQLGSLERLEISHCDGMKHVVKEMQNEKPSVSKLEPKPEEEIQEVTGHGTNGVMHYTDFPKLKSIVLNSLNLLESICSARNFCCLESIRVEACPKLKRLPVSDNSKMSKLKQICGSYEWWKQLIWEEETTRKKSDVYFIQI